jgi:outer membrane protein assembly factor BamB
MQDQTLYVGTQGALRALDFDGNEIWTYHLKGSDVDISSGPVVARAPQRQGEQPLVFFGTQGGSLHAIQARVRLCTAT